MISKERRCESTKIPPVSGHRSDMGITSQLSQKKINTVSRRNGQAVINVHPNKHLLSLFNTTFHTFFIFLFLFSHHSIRFYTITLFYSFSFVFFFSLSQYIFLFHSFNSLQLLFLTNIDVIFFLSFFLSFCLFVSLLFSSLSFLFFNLQPLE